MALRRQVPIIYVIATANVLALQVTTHGKVTFGLNLTTILFVCAVVRTCHWLGANPSPLHSVMVRRMRQTCGFAATLCLAVAWWCLYLLDTAASDTHMAIFLFGGFTALGVAFGLSAVPTAACIPLIILGLPLAVVGLRSPNPKYVGAAVSLGILMILIMQLVARQSAQFTAIVRSRWMIGHQQELTETARQEAVVAATTDFLTGLPNRRAFVAAVAECADSRHPFAVAVIDVDRFKVINDTYGHSYGDELLKAVAQRLLRTAGNSCLVARLGGDEFGLLLRGATAPAEARDWGKRILTGTNRPVTIKRRKFPITASCGIGLSRDGKARTPSRVLADADIALYEAKSQATDRVAVFEQGMEAPRHRRAQIEHALQASGVHNQIKVYFQPIVDLRSGRAVAQEALARWMDNELGNVPPSEFVPIAEQLNVIGDLSDHLMAMALAEAARWDPAIRLSFNLSAIQLCSADLAEKVLSALETAGVGADRLQVEVTETALFADFARAKQNLATLRSAGVTVVLDDFGAGYASIGYLREFQFDQIKLDGGLVTAALDNADGESLLGAVIGLCRAIGVPTVAEHIESEQHLSLLLKLGCTLGQGYWLQPPTPAEELIHGSGTRSLYEPDRIGRSRSAA
ncbi:putative bifunctional diguanylate cyclase/phosphodiesterase [Sphingomonas sp. GCM10030256]|uniref:putative bifunctional diguanylate cyclase/phosphodiesterase n=1 Tax=Sphingomonas sp. GCM10030256 TaxID=3273427 RepID=UPI00361FEA25